MLLYPFKIRPAQSRLAMRLFTLSFFALVAPLAQPQADRPVKAIAHQAVMLNTPQGAASIPLERSQDWSHPLPRVTRAVLVVHGLHRNAESAYRALEAAAGRAHAGESTLLLAPQFLDETDVDAYRLPANFLRWHRSRWDSGEPALAPVPMSAYAVLDALLLKLSDRTLFPNLRTVVVAGHSAGGQTVQRYAIAGKVFARLESSGIHLRFVVASPSSYFYFTAERPVAGSTPLRFAVPEPARCPASNRWKYGTVDAPPYVAEGAGQDWQRAEADYAARDVLYLLGTADNDPHHPELDTSCAGQAEGPDRLSRGQAYVAWLRARHALQWKQRMWYVPGVDHDSERMFNSACGVGALFDTGSCPDQ